MSRVRAPDGAPREDQKVGLVGQAVKTPASHAGNTGSIPVRVTRDWKLRKRENKGKRKGNNREKEVGIEDVEGTPVPIPNTEVKLNGAENTRLETVWEDREMPT